MTTLTEQLLFLYRKNPHLAKLIEDVDFVTTFKRLLVSRVESENALYFNPSDIRNISISSNMLALEFLICLSKEEEVFEKHYVLTCPSCQVQRRSKELEVLYTCTNQKCVPMVGEVLVDFIMKNIYFQFTISDKIHPLVIEELINKKKRGVEKYDK